MDETSDLRARRRRQEALTHKHAGPDRDQEQRVCLVELSGLEPPQSINHVPSQPKAAATCQSGVVAAFPDTRDIRLSRSR